MKTRSEWAIYGPNIKPEASLIKGRCDRTVVTTRLCAVSEVKGLRGQKVRNPSVSQNICWGASSDIHRFAASIFLRAVSQMHEMAEVLTSCPAADEGVWNTLRSYRRISGISCSCLRPQCHKRVAPSAVWSRYSCHFPSARIFVYITIRRAPTLTQTAKPFLKGHINFPATQGIRQFYVAHRFKTVLTTARRRPIC